MTQLAASALAEDQRTIFERDGYLVLPQVLDGNEVAYYTAMVDVLYRRAGLPDALHRLSAVHACPGLAPLVDHPRVLGPVCSILGYFGYTYRWVRSRDRAPATAGECTPVQRQLLGLLDEPDPDHAWGHEPDSVPLYEMFRSDRFTSEA